MSVVSLLSRPLSILASPKARSVGALSAVFLLIVIAVVGLALLCMDLLSSARAYVGGESMWSKGEKSAVARLVQYAETRNADHWRRYQQWIAIPLGDHVAREELEKPHPDLALVRKGFLAGGIHPDDVAGMVRLFRWFRHVEFLDRAIAIWAEGDRLIAELTRQADEIHGLVEEGADAATLSGAVARVYETDDRLTTLEVAFSETLGAASRTTQRLLTAAMSVVTVLLVALGAAIVLRVTQRLEQRVAARTLQLTAANTRLQELDRLKSEFVATMSHELRTPLNAIVGFTALLLEGASGPINDKQRHHLRLVERSAEHLLALIGDVLDITRIESGRMEVQSEPFDLVGVIAEVDASVRPMAERKALQLRCETPADGLPMQGDRRKCFQILLNLADNALKFTLQGEVRIAAGRDQNVIWVRVADTGIGIAADDLPLLFERFRQLDSGHGRGQEGTGLGLFLSRKLAELMGGKIEVESTPGAGSTFTVTLPSRAT